MAYKAFTRRFSKSRQIATFMKRAIEEESIRSDGKAAIDDGTGGKVAVASTGGLDSAATISLITSTATSLSDVRTISLDSGEVLTLIDSAYISARAGGGGGAFSNDASNNIYSYNAGTGISTSVTGANNISMGLNSLDDITSGALNIAIGKDASQYLTTGPGNIAIGEFSNGGQSASSTANDNNVAIGNYAAGLAYGITYSISIGYQAGYQQQNRSRNIMIGHQAGYNLTAADRICIGYRAGYTGSNGTGSVSIGYQAGYNTSNNYNIGIGYQAGFYGGGAYNTSIGYTAGSQLDGNYNVLLGYDAEPTGTSSSNQCIIGNRTSTGMINYLQVGSYMTMNSGTLTMSGNVTAYSDARLKTNVETVSGLDKVTQMRGVTFEKDGQQGTGVIAQEMLEVAPELVHEEHDYYSVNYSGLSGYFIEAIKEQQKQIEELKEEIKKLKGE
jgi:hypothetical protein